MKDNRTILAKADLALADLASGGILQTAQAKTFIRLAIRNAAFMSQITATTMNAPSEERDKIRFSSRVLKPGTEATALALAQRSKPALSKVTLNAKLFRGEVRMSDEVLEDQIENGSFQNTIVEELSKAISRDMDTVVINGDTASADPLLAVLDGVLKQANVNTVDAGTVALSKTVLRNTVLALDDEYIKDPSLKFWTNRRATHDYHDSLGDRATQLGDQKTVDQSSDTYHGFPIEMIPEFPPTAETGGAVTHVLLTSPSNILLGIWRRIKIAMQSDAPAGVVIIVPSLRFDVKIVETTAAARAFNVVG